jgi:dTDP-4-amino-4,6-dideoxygalactose transaminase
VDIPLHRACGQSPDPFPVTEKVFRTAVSIPLYPRLTDENIRQIVDGVRSVFS